MNQASLLKNLEYFQGMKILVVGDFILDAYFSGLVDRVSPEAPVPILNIQSKEYRLGGAANVAVNLKQLGANPILCSVVGNDEGGEKAFELFERESLSTEGLVKSSQRPTSIKTRLMGGHVQMLRMDEEVTDDLSQQENSGLATRIEGLIEKFDPKAIVFEDYNKGVLTKTLISSIMEKAKARGIITTVDPKRNNFFAFAGATLFKPNLIELKEGLNLLDLKVSTESLMDAFKKLNDVMPVTSALFTLSEKGVFITNGSENFHQEAMPRMITDVSGAGDTVIAVATCCLVAGMSLSETAYISNLAGGFVCQFPGVVPVSFENLKTEILKLT